MHVLLVTQGTTQVIYGPYATVEEAHRAESKLDEILAPFGAEVDYDIEELRTLDVAEAIEPVATEHTCPPQVVIVRDPYQYLPYQYPVYTPPVFPVSPYRVTWSAPTVSSTPAISWNIS